MIIFVEILIYIAEIETKSICGYVIDLIYQSVIIVQLRAFMALQGEISCMSLNISVFSSFPQCSSHPPVW